MPTPGEVIDAVLTARKAEQAAALEQLELALVWARMHPCAKGGTPAYWGELDLHGEATVLLAGPGAPTVAEFAPMDLAAALDVSMDAANSLLGDALELHFRLPRLMEHVRSGVVPVWRARQIASLTIDLSWDAVTFADKLVSATPQRISQVRAERLVHEARLFFDPDRAAADEEEAQSRRGVWLHQDRANPATTEVVMSLDSDDAHLFDQTVSRIAAELRDLGDTDSRDERRSKAVGVLADPQFALDLMSGREGAAPTKGSRQGHLDLFCHLTPDDLTHEAGTGSGLGAVAVERLGAVTSDLLSQWLAKHAAAGGIIRIRPILDLNRDWAVDQHDPPEAMREQVLQLHASCVFPGCRRDARACDLDHIEPYVPIDEGGPPGQTRPDNLAPLCRRHHRAKTFSAWTYKHLGPGHYTWTSPTGHQYDVSATPRHHRRTS